MYSIPKIISEYEKNKYQPAFCWTCYTPIGEITKYITCSVCDKGPSYNDIKEVTDEQQQNVKLDINTIDKIISEFDNTIYFLEEDYTI